MFTLHENWDFKNKPNNVIDTDSILPHNPLVTHNPTPQEQMKTLTDKLTGQEAIDFAKETGTDLYTEDFRHAQVRTRSISIAEAEEMLSEGIESFWCWTIEEPEIDDEPPSFTPEEFMEDNPGFRACSCEDYPCCGH